MDHCAFRNWYDTTDCHQPAWVSRIFEEDWDVGLKGGQQRLEGKNKENNFISWKGSEIHPIHTSAFLLSVGVTPVGPYSVSGNARKNQVEPQDLHKLKRSTWKVTLKQNWIRQKKRCKTKSQQVFLERFWGKMNCKVPPQGQDSRHSKKKRRRERKRIGRKEKRDQNQVLQRGLLLETQMLVMVQCMIVLDAEPSKRLGFELFHESCKSNLYILD